MQTTTATTTKSARMLRHENAIADDARQFIAQLWEDVKTAQATRQQAQRHAPSATNRTTDRPDTDPAPQG